MEKKNGILKVILIISGALVSLAGAIAILYTVVKKHFKFTIELCPEDGEVCDCEGEECICGCCHDDCVDEIVEEVEDDDISICPEDCERDDDVHCKKASDDEE